MNARSLIIFTCLFSCSFAVHVAIKNSDEPTSTYCIILDSNITGTINYNNKNNESVAYDFAINGTSVNFSGQCHAVVPSSNSSVEYVEISFFPNDVTIIPIPRDRWSLKLTFKAPDSASPPTKSFIISDYQLDVVFYPQVFENASKSSDTYTKSDEANLEWSAEGKHGFTCSKSELPLTQNSKVVFDGLKVVAFALLEKGDFPTDQIFEQCQLDTRTSDLVPIIVGACLAGLVIVVLIAYAIGRVRAKRQGYSSV